MIDIVRQYVLRYAWVGARDAAGNDVHVFVGSGEVVDDNSYLWHTSKPDHGIMDCVLAYGWVDPARLYDYSCSTTRPCHICEVY